MFPVANDSAFEVDNDNDDTDVFYCLICFCIIKSKMFILTGTHIEP